VKLPAGMSVIVPVYNSFDILPILTQRLCAVLTQLGEPFEIIFVDDGSCDDSWATICGIASKKPEVRGLSMMRNYGQHNALLAGIRAARFELTATMDDDLQHPPEELPKLIAKLHEGFDVVYGTPEKEPHGFWRGLASRVTKIALQSAMGAETARVVSAWRVLRTGLRAAFESYHSPFVSLDVLLTWGTTKFGSVRVRHDPRRIGKSNYSFRALVRHALTMMTGFSVLPLQIASIIGFTFTLFGILILMFVVTKFLLWGTSVAGFPFLASIIAIFSGAQLFALGIIGEYLARVHFRTMEKPAYAIQQWTDNVSK
jgi:glycosyltransferase involved in cell wall biosynthesis